MFHIFKEFRVIPSVDVNKIPKLKMAILTTCTIKNQSPSNLNKKTTLHKTLPSGFQQCFGDDCRK